MPDSVQERAVPGTDVWRSGRGLFAGRPQLTDFLIALLAFGMTLMMWSSDSDHDVLSMDSFSDVGAWLCAFVGSFALLWRRSHPWQVHATVLAASILVFLGATSDGIVALSFSLYSLGRYEADRHMSLLGVIAALAFLIVDMGLIFAPGAGSTIAAVLAFAIWYVGRRLRFRGEYLRLLEDRALNLERRRNADAARAVAAERTRIAREMHDVVAHQVSLITVQAGAARTIGKSDPEAAIEAMAAVEAAGRHALSEMRHLLGVLRPADSSDSLNPQPGIDDLPALVRKVGEVGPVVALDMSGELSGLPARLELTIYRIVQEALTNVVKHAGINVHADVSVNARGDRVVVTVEDSGAGGDPGPSSGHGIVGMRERAELLGGSFSVDSRPTGGFKIRAVLPVKQGED